MLLSFRDRSPTALTAGVIKLPQISKIILTEDYLIRVGTVAEFSSLSVCKKCFGTETISNAIIIISLIAT
jgi:hypothetical protein